MVSLPTFERLGIATHFLTTENREVIGHFPSPLGLLGHWSWFASWCCLTSPNGLNPNNLAPNFLVRFRIYVGLRSAG